MFHDLRVEPPDPIVPLVDGRVEHAIGHIEPKVGLAHRHEGIDIALVERLVGPPHDLGFG
jgi:hypothetical protein